MVPPFVDACPRAAKDAANALGIAAALVAAVVVPWYCSHPTPSRAGSCSTACATCATASSTLSPTVTRSAGSSLERSRSTWSCSSAWARRRPVDARSHPGTQLHVPGPALYARAADGLAAGARAVALRDFVAKLAAASRYTVFGKSDECRAPSGDFAARFIDFVEKPDADPSPAAAVRCDDLELRIGRARLSAINDCIAVLRRVPRRLELRQLRRSFPSG